MARFRCAVNIRSISVNSMYGITAVSSISVQMVPLSFTWGILVQLKDFKGTEDFGSFGLLFFEGGCCKVRCCVGGGGGGMV